MVMSVATRPTPVKITFEEYLALPDDGHRYELIDGELIMVGGPSTSHQLVFGVLFIRFSDVIARTDGGWVFSGPYEVKFPGDNTVQPDIVVVLRDRAQVLTEERIVGTPSLVLELLSPSTRDYALTTKLNLYARNAVPEYWVVDLIAETITVFALHGDKYLPEPPSALARSRLIPDLTVDAPALFAAARLP